MGTPTASAQSVPQRVRAIWFLAKDDEEAEYKKKTNKEKTNLTVSLGGEGEGKDLSFPYCLFKTTSLNERRKKEKGRRKERMAEKKGAGAQLSNLLAMGGGGGVTVVSVKARGEVVGVPSLTCPVSRLSPSP